MKSNGTTFGWQSNMQEDQMRKYQNVTDKQIGIVSQSLQSNIPEVRDPDGALILNASPENMWFSENVAFVFGIGCIYDEEDETLMNTILSCFNNSRDSGFFMNHYRVESYDTSALIQEIEKKLKITNGNYHVFMVPIVTADGEALKKAPEGQFSRKGIVNKFMKWQTITAYMQEMMAKYGLITELRREHEEYSWEMGQEGLATRRSNKDDVECKFDIDADPDGRVMMEIEKNLSVQRDLHDNYNNRVREGKAQRDGQLNAKSQTRSKRKSLYQQMHEEKVGGIPVDSVPDQYDGVELRMNERYMPQTKKVVEYQLYEDGDGRMGDEGADLTTEKKNEMPRFMQTAVRGSKTRGPTMGGHMLHMKVMN